MKLLLWMSVRMLSRNEIIAVDVGAYVAPPEPEPTP